MKTTIEKDGDGYLARVTGHPNLFSFAYSGAKGQVLQSSILNNPDNPVE